MMPPMGSLTLVVAVLSYAGQLNLLRPVHPDGEQLVATGTVLHRGRRLAIGTADVRHGGRLVAVVTGTTELTPGS
jgi:acyl-coenzyme A thioesterase PaaI-like protein